MKNNLSKKILVIISIFMMIVLTSCNGFFKYSPARENPTKGVDRAKKNVEEGAFDGKAVLFEGNEHKYESLSVKQKEFLRKWYKRNGNKY